MGCSNTGPFDGGVWSNATIIDPTLNGGSVANSTLTNVTLSSNITIDDDVAQKITDAICPHVNKCVVFDETQVAAVFRNCSGVEHEPGAQIPTCNEMDQAIAEAMAPQISDALPPVTNPAEGDNVLPTTIVGTDRSQLLGKPNTYIVWGEYLIPAYKV